MTYWHARNQGKSMDSKTQKDSAVVKTPHFQRRGTGARQTLYHLSHEGSLESYIWASRIPKVGLQGTLQVED